MFRNKTPLFPVSCKAIEIKVKLVKYETVIHIGLLLHLYEISLALLFVFVKRLFEFFEIFFYCIKALL